MKIAALALLLAAGPTAAATMTSPGRIQSTPLAAGAQDYDAATIARLCGAAPTALSADDAARAQSLRIQGRCPAAH